MKITITVLSKRQRARFCIYKKGKNAKLFYTKNRKLYKKQKKLHYVFIYKDQKNLRYAIFHNNFEVGIYTQKT